MVAGTTTIKPPCGGIFESRLSASSSQKRVRDAVVRFPRHEAALLCWYKLVKTTTFNIFAELRNAFAGVDKVGRYFVFNVAGSHLRIIAAVHFDRRRVYIRALPTHSEYDQGMWNR